LKNPEEFRAAVYARAEERKARESARRRRLRLTLAPLCVLAIILAAAPLLRLGYLLPANRSAYETVPDGKTEFHFALPQAKAKNASGYQMVMMLSQADKTSSKLLKNSKEQKEFFADLKETNALPEGEQLQMVPQLDQTAIIKSRQELDAYLAEIGADAAKTFGSAVKPYDDAYFEQNALRVNPIEVVPAPHEAPEGTTASTAGQVVSRVIYTTAAPRSQPSASVTTAPTTGFSEPSSPAAGQPPSPTQEPATTGAAVLPTSAAESPIEVTGWLLVPMSKEAAE
jgi:hypothetical protein